MTNISEWAKSHQTSVEIARAICDMYPARVTPVWADPTPEEEGRVLERAWLIADPNKNELCWGEESFARHEVDEEETELDLSPYEVDEDEVPTERSYATAGKMLAEDSYLSPEGDAWVNGGPIVVDTAAKLTRRKPTPTNQIRNFRFDTYHYYINGRRYYPPREVAPLRYDWLYSSACTRTIPHDPNVRRHTHRTAMLENRAEREWCANPVRPGAPKTPNV